MGKKCRFYVDIMAMHEEVTGSCNLAIVKFPNGETLRFVTDCGLFQERKYDELNNALPFDPEKVDFCLITHTHVDHIGRLPYMVKKGFYRPIYVTETTNKIEDATKYTQEGYYGADVNEMILNLLENANMDIKKAQNGIIVIDEIDKKAGHEVPHDVAGTEVLKSLLKIIEGTTIKVPVEMDSYNVKLVDFDTKNIIIIFLGAFSGLDIIRDKRLNSNPLGFSIKEETHKSKAKFLKQDLVKYGLPEEFVGRIDTIVEMNELTKKDLALILKKSELSIFKRYQNELSNMGITLIYNDDLFESIAEKSLVLDTGARELSNTVNYMFENIVFDVLSNPNKYKKCILDTEIAQNNTKYTLS